MPSTKTLNQSPTISAVENADLLWVWDSSASELNKISRTNLLTTTDDFNVSYARLAGRSGGQTLIGGTAANDDLTLEGTSNATRTTSYVILQPNGGNVGIGTTSPSGKLEIVGDAAVNSRSITASVAPGAAGRSGSFVLKSTLDSALGSFDAARLSFYGNQTWQNAADYLGFDIATGNDTWATKMALLGNGNVGIGTTSPSGKLEIVGDAAVNSRSITASVAPGATGRSGSFVLKSTLDSPSGPFDAARLSFYGNETWQSAADYLGFDIATGNDAWATKMALLGNGNVGIGTTSPSRKLHVAGTILIDGDEGSGIAGTIGLTDINDATLSTGNGTVKLKGTTARDSAGFIKIYVGATTAWIPYWTNIS